MAEDHYKIQAIMLKAIGILQLLIGILAAFYGPYEIYVFYLFSEPGPFYYAGFGVGSFWFALLVGQNLAYYLLAALLIPVGIGTLRLCRWALTLSILYLWGWLAGGLVLLLNLGLLTPAVFKLGQTAAVRWLVVGAFAFSFFVILPVILLRFYTSKKVRLVFEENDPNLYWTEKRPFPVLALLFLYSVCILVLHVAIFFQVLFPLFGKILFGRPAIYLHAASFVILLGLIYGTFRLKGWAWWGGLVYSSLLTISVILSFGNYRFNQIVQMMNLPAYEVEFLEKVTVLHDYHLVGLLALPLLTILGLLIYSRKYFFRKPLMVRSSYAGNPGG